LVLRLILRWLLCRTLCPLFWLLLFSLLWWLLTCRLLILRGYLGRDVALSDAACRWGILAFLGWRIHGIRAYFLFLRLRLLFLCLFGIMVYALQNPRSLLGSHYLLHKLALARVHVCLKTADGPPLQGWHCLCRPLPGWQCCGPLKRRLVLLAGSHQF
jgi:hypothetical protein